MTPSVGSRVSIRHRLPTGEFTDVIGHLLAVTPLVVVRTKSGALNEISPDDVIAVRELSHRPVRASEIRALEHAAALAWPGTEQHWQDGWLLRAAGGYTSRANSAVPLDFAATVAALPAIVDWYASRGLPPWLALPDRLIAVRGLGGGVGIKHTRVMAADLVDAAPVAGVDLQDRPDAAWLAGYGRDVPPEVLTAVVDGEVVFATVAGAAVGRGAVTTAPDGARWLGISAVHVPPERRRRGHARAVCRALAKWGADRGADRVYVQVLTDNTPAITLYTSLGFGLHHHHRYVDARDLAARRV